MPFAISADRHLIRTAMDGVVTLQDLKEFLAELEAIEASMGRAPDRLTDLTGMTDATMTAEDMRHLAGRRRRACFPNSFRSAIVAPHDFQVGYARMFQMLNDHPDISIRVFGTAAEAEAWLSSS